MARRAKRKVWIIVAIGVVSLVIVAAIVVPVRPDPAEVALLSAVEKFDLTCTSDTVVGPNPYHPEVSYQTLFESRNMALNHFTKFVASLDASVEGKQWHRDLRTLPPSAGEVSPYEYRIYLGELDWGTLSITVSTLQKSDSTVMVFVVMTKTPLETWPRIKKRLGLSPDPPAPRETPPI